MATASAAAVSPWPPSRLAAVFIASGTQAEGARLASIVLAGVMNTGGQIGGIVTASLTLLIAHQFSWTTSFLAGAALCAAPDLLAWLVVDPSVELGR